ncbi:GMP synthase [glutamine-hydrolyzing] [Striga asiatica]|uniref:GMP synthase [glutamine-hydrolyzing] n=1 Tax=Striga asiatica TaxID=4170 RepID=A0A5A7Q382_STRAF|nr:GMP synthase [glutamine-hydrolyzing] [Striga asiatica]
MSPVICRGGKLKRKKLAESSHDLRRVDCRRRTQTSWSVVGVKFLVADWERLPGFGIGEQLARMCGLLAIAINEKRVLVTGYYNRADHDGCKDLTRVQKMSLRACARQGSMADRVWGSSWSSMQPTTEINRTLIAIRYLMRYQNEYTCGIMNKVRHSAFGREAAKMVLELSSENLRRTEHDIEKFVWSNHNLWLPRPLLSMHVRMGDKACEMTFSDLKNNAFSEQSPGALPALQECVAFYRNAGRVKFDVIDRSKSYEWHQKCYYTNVRQ